MLTKYTVHFLLRDHLDRGFNSTSTYDTLGKNVGEYLVRAMMRRALFTVLRFQIANKISPAF